MANAKVGILMAMLAGIGVAIYVFRDQISGLFAPPAECPAGWLLDVGSGQCCPEGFTYNSTTGKCVRTGTTETVTPKATTLTEQQRATIITQQIPAPTPTQIIIDPTKAYAWIAPSKPIGPATPSVGYSAEAQPTGTQAMYNYYFRVETLPGAKPVVGARIDIAGVDWQTEGILYTGSDGVANFLKQVPGRYKYVVYVGGVKKVEGIAEFDAYEGQEMVVQIPG